MTIVNTEFVTADTSLAPPWFSIFIHALIFGEHNVWGCVSLFQLWTSKNASSTFLRYSPTCQTVTDRSVQGFIIYSSSPLSWRMAITRTVSYNGQNSCRACCIILIFLLAGFPHWICGAADETLSSSSMQSLIAFGITFPRDKFIYLRFEEMTFCTNIDIVFYEKFYICRWCL